MEATSLLLSLQTAGFRVSRNGDKLIVAPRDRLTDELRSAIRQGKNQLLSVLAAAPTIESPTRASDADPWPDCAAMSPIQESARREVLAQLAANPTVKRSFVTRFENGTLIVTLAVRGIGTCELLISAERFTRDSLDDYDALLDCIRAGGNA